MKGTLDLETLTRLVQAGEIDTVLVCFPDVQGRLLGKREYDRRITDWELIRSFERA